MTSGYLGKYARLNNDNAWCIPTNPGGIDVYFKSIFIEIDLQFPLRITALALQGDDKYSYGDFIRIYHQQSSIWMLYDPDKEKQVREASISISLSISNKYLQLLHSLEPSKHPTSIRRRVLIPC